MSCSVLYHNTQLIWQWCLHSTCLSFDIIFAVILAAQPLCREEQRCQLSSLASIYLTDCDWLRSQSLKKKCFTGLFHSSLSSEMYHFYRSLLQRADTAVIRGFFFVRRQSISYFNKWDDTVTCIITFVEITVFNSTQMWGLLQGHMFSAEWIVWKKRSWWIDWHKIEWIN